MGRIEKIFNEAVRSINAHKESIVFCRRSGLIPFTQLIFFLECFFVRKKAIFSFHAQVRDAINKKNGVNGI